MNQLRGHFEFELGDGTKLPCLLNLYALHVWCQETDTPLSDIDKALKDEPLSAIPGLLWSGVRAAYGVEDAEPPMTRRKFEIVLGSTEWDAIVTKLTDSMSLLGDTPQKKTQRKGNS